MNPFSRHRFCLTQTDEAGRLYLNDRVPFGYQDFSDNRTRICRGGERLFQVAGEMFRGLWRPTGLFWIIADFQPQPIHDPSLDLVPGTTLIVPSIRTVLEQIFNERRQFEVVA